MQGSVEVRLNRMTGWFMLAMLVVCAAGQGRQDALVGLARAGQIQQDAPVKASSAVVIHAPIARVWQLLSEIDRWPTWQAGVSEARIRGSLAAGTEFRWVSGGTKIESRLEVVEAPTELVWTGTAYRARAIHVWRLEALPDGTTRVSTAESMDGPLLRFFYSSKDLASSHAVWLAALKKKAEAQ